LLFSGDPQRVAMHRAYLRAITADVLYKELLRYSGYVTIPTVPVPVRHSDLTSTGNDLVFERIEKPSMPGQKQLAGMNPSAVHIMMPKEEVIPVNRSVLPQSSNRPAV